MLRIIKNKKYSCSQTEIYSVVSTEERLLPIPTMIDWCHQLVDKVNKESCRGGGGGVTNISLTVRGALGLVRGERLFLARLPGRCLGIIELQA